MKPESAAYFAKAEESLDKAKRIFAIGIYDEAGRSAYYAQFHATQALIFERTDKTTKSHKGASKELHRIATIEAAMPPELPAQLSKSYLYKAIADYDTGVAPAVTPAQAKDAIAVAEGFVAAIHRLLP